MLHRNSLGKCDLWVPHALDVTEATQAISDTDPLKSANSVCSALQKRKTGEIVSERMAATHNKSGLRGHALSRRIIVVVVPPVDELDLVGPLQVFSSVNRLSSRNIYAIEVVTNTDRLTVEGEAGVLTFSPSITSAKLKALVTPSFWFADWAVVRCAARRSLRG
jgi:hypothetical protein